MKRRQQGWTLVEMLVSTSILVLLMVVMADALITTQRSWLVSRSAADLQQSLDLAAGVISRGLSQATLPTRPCYDTMAGRVAPASDLHFVCGPAVELLPALAGVCGDAVFFQHPALDVGTGLRQALQCGGFWVQYGGDEAWRPSFSSAIPVRRRFRLMQLHQPAGGLTLFQPTGVNGEPPRLSQMTSRADLYGWFSQPVSAGAGSNGYNNVSVVAENVVAMIVQTMPAAQRCYDTRRQQWEPGSAAALLSRNQLPEMSEVTLVMTDEASWARMSTESAEAFAAELRNFIQAQSWLPDAMPQSLAAVKQMIASHGIKVSVAVINAGMGG